MNPKIVGRFHKGEPIPSWMLIQEPRQPNSVAGLLTFNVDCVILETRGGFVIVPEENFDAAPVLLDSAAYITLKASSRTIVVPVNWEMLGGPDDEPPPPGTKMFSFGP